MSRQWTILLLVIAMPIAAATPPVHHYVTIGVEGGALHVNKQYWGAEASFGGGYALERNHFMLALSLQAGYQHASARQTDYATHEPAIDDENKPYILNSIYTNGKAQYHMVNIALPILFGGASEHFYGLVGPVIGMQVYGKESNQYSLTTTGDYDPMIETFHDMPNHGFYTRDTRSQKQLGNSYMVKSMLELGSRIPLRPAPSRKRAKDELHIGVYATYPLIYSAPLTKESFSVGIKCSIWWNIPSSLPCRCVNN